MLTHTCNAQNLFNSRKLYKRSENKYYTAINKTQSRIDKCMRNKQSERMKAGKENNREKKYERT